MHYFLDHGLPILLIFCFVVNYLYAGSRWTTCITPHLLSILRSDLSKKDDDDERVTRDDVVGMIGFAYEVVLLAVLIL